MKVKVYKFTRYRDGQIRYYYSEKIGKVLKQYSAYNTEECFIDIPEWFNPVKSANGIVYFTAGGKQYRLDEGLGVDSNGNPTLAWYDEEKMESISVPLEMCKA